MSKVNINPEDVIYIVKKYHDNIIDFCKEVLKADLDDWQVDFLLACQKDPRVAVRAGNSVGKSYAVGCLAIWFLITKPNALVVLVANSEAQVKDRTMRTCANILSQSIIKDWFDPTATKISLITDPTIYITIAVGSKSNPDAIRGFHAQNYLLVIDEAQGIDPEIFKALETTVASNNSKMVMIGNPTRLGTDFHKAFYENQKYWNCKKVDGRFCKHVNKDWINKTIEENGIDSDYVRMTILGEFPKQSAQQFLPPQIWRDCQVYEVSEQVYKTFPVVLGVDIARGGEDFCVICVKQGRKVLKFIKFQADDHFKIAQIVSDTFNEYQAKVVIVDETGMGSGTVDVLKNVYLKPSQVIGKNFARSASNSTKYANTRQELWGEGKLKLKAGIAIPSEYIKDLVDETEGIECYFDKKNRIFVETKDEMKRKGLASPDMTDALFLALAIDPPIAPPAPPPDPDWAMNLPQTRRNKPSSWQSI